MRHYDNLEKNFNSIKKEQDLAYLTESCTPEALHQKLMRKTVYFFFYISS